MFKTDSLTPEIKKIVINKSTERPNIEVCQFPAQSTYICRNCGTALFLAVNKFDSRSGWPSFDLEIATKISKITDEDNIRTEVLCSICQSHLGHVFYGEGYTNLNTRYCINSLAIESVPSIIITDTEEAIVAAGCFWGVEYLFKKLNGVLKTVVGYIGGTVANPNYVLVCTGNSNYVEAVRIIYDPQIIAYSDIIRYFFEIHDFRQTTGQGNDIGSQYLSKIYYFNDLQRELAIQTVNLLTAKNYLVATQLEKVTTFWPAEDYHQDYYNKTNGTPYCHFRKKYFNF